MEITGASSIYQSLQSFEPYGTAQSEDLRAICEARLVEVCSQAKCFSLWLMGNVDSLSSMPVASREATVDSYQEAWEVVVRGIGVCQAILSRASDYCFAHKPEAIALYAQAPAVYAASKAEAERKLKGHSTLLRHLLSIALQHSPDCPGLMKAATGAEGLSEIMELFNSHLLEPVKARDVSFREVKAALQGLLRERHDYRALGAYKENATKVRDRIKGIGSRLDGMQSLEALLPQLADEGEACVLFEAALRREAEAMAPALHQSADYTAASMSLSHCTLL